MKNLVDYIDESLIKSYDTEKLKKALNKKYKINDFHDYKSKSDEPKRFAFGTDEDLYNKLMSDEGFFKLIDLYGYTLTEINCIDNKIYDLHLEPNFGKKCNELVYDKCNGIVWHVSKKKFEEFVAKDGIKPRAGKDYRIFSERVFLSCGETSQEMVDNVKFLIKQLAIPEGKYVIYKIDLKRNRHHPYNVNFYYDPSEDDKHNFIYANAIFFPHLIVNEFHSIDEMQNDLKKIDENLVFKLKRNK